MSLVVGLCEVPSGQQTVSSCALCACACAHCRRRRWYLQYPLFTLLPFVYIQLNCTVRLVLYTY